MAPSFQQLTNLSSLYRLHEIVQKTAVVCGNENLQNTRSVDIPFLPILLITLPWGPSAQLTPSTLSTVLSTHFFLILVFTMMINELTVWIHKIKQKQKRAKIKQAINLKKQNKKTLGLLIALGITFPENWQKSGE